MIEDRDVASCWDEVKWRWYTEGVFGVWWRKRWGPFKAIKGGQDVACVKKFKNFFTIKR